MKEHQQHPSARISWVTRFVSSIIVVELLILQIKCCVSSTDASFRSIPSISSELGSSLFPNRKNKLISRSQRNEVRGGATTSTTSKADGPNRSSVKKHSNIGIKAKNVLKSIMEPVAVVAISDENNIPYKHDCERQVDPDGNNSRDTANYEETKGKIMISTNKNSIRQKLQRAGGGAMVKQRVGRKNEYQAENQADEHHLDDKRRESVCQYVNHILNRRLEQVIGKKRSKDFTFRFKKYLEAVDGKNTVLSLHGREEKVVVDEGQNSSDNLDGVVKESENQQRSINDSIMSAENNMEILVNEKDTFFPENLLSLDMVFTEQMFDLAMEEIEKKYENQMLDHHTMYTNEVMFIPKLILRAIHLGLNFAPVTLTLGLASFSKDFREKVWYNLVGRCLAKSGPAFIKWGQWASTRPDVFPDTLCQVLSELHADAPSHSWQVTQDIVEEALCIPAGALYDVFEEFDQDPVASGSIAQVHRAVLRRPRGNEYMRKGKLSQKQAAQNKCVQVAVKVRHPHVSRLIDMDFRLMAMVAKVVDRFPALSWLRVKDSVEQFSHTMSAQAYLNVEAHHLEVLNHNFRNWETVQFPQPVFACSSVIIETFEKGEICSGLIDRYDSLALTKSSGKNSVDGGHELMPVPLAKFIVTTGLSLYLKMLLVDNLMHADLHPGNILLDCQIFGEQYGDVSPLVNSIPVGGAEVAVARPSQKKLVSKATPPRVEDGFYGQVTLVDAGMVAQLDDHESENFIGLLCAVGEGDGRAAAEAILKFKSDYSTESNLGPNEREAFITDMVELFGERCRGYGTNIDFGDVLRGALGIVKKHHVQLGANYATLVVNALCLDGLARRVCPTYNLIDAAKPLLRGYHSLHVSTNKVEKRKFLANRPKLRKSLIRVAAPLLYMKKHSEDNRFFKRIEERRKLPTAITKTRKRNRNRPLRKSAFVFAKISRILIAGLAGIMIHHSLSVGVNQSTNEDSSQKRNAAVRTSEEKNLFHMIGRFFGEYN